MSQDTSTNQRESQASSSTSIQPWSVEAKADALMDDIFSDIDRILEGGSASPPEPEKAEYVSLQPLKIPQITALQPTWVSPAVKKTQQVRETGSALARPNSLDLDLIDTIAEEREKRRGSGQSFDKLLLGVACASLAVTMLLWLASQNRLNWLFSSTTPPAVSPVSQEATTKVDEQFANYMLRSLDVITRKAEAQKHREASKVSPTANLPPVPPVPNNVAQANRGGGVLERVYIPIYQPPPNPAPVKPVPTPPAQLSARLPAMPVAPPPAPVPPPVAVTPKPPSPLPAPIPAAPPQPIPVSPTPTPSEVTPTANHTLVGLLELGERSAALFNISGSTQRIQIGESIGSSGWILVSVSNQEAIIRRNGEVRSIYVGQKF